MFIVTACHTEGTNQGVSTEAAGTSDKAISHEKIDTIATSPVFPGTDAFQLGCELVQDQAEMLLEEYHRKGTADKRLQQIISELKQLEKQWKERSCQQVFGHMIPEIPHFPHKVQKTTQKK